MTNIYVDINMAIVYVNVSDVVFTADRNCK